MAKSPSTASTGTNAGDDPRNVQTERVLRWAWRAMLVGLAILAVAALTVPDISGWRFFAVGALAGLAAAAAGGALGLLFGLPISNQTVVVVTQSAAQPTPQQQGAEGSAARPQSADWFRDNTSMEQIADWLTKIIVGLTLTQWASFQSGFDRLAAAVTAAMMPPAPSVRSSMAVLDMSKVPGGLILAAYTILGFLLVYIWARIYLSSEFASARGAQRRVQRESDREFIDRAQDQDGVQAQPHNANVRELADNAVTDAETSEVLGQLPDAPLSSLATVRNLVRWNRGDRATHPLPAVVKPGDVEDDPWKGGFGGKPSDGQVGVSASVRQLDTPSLYALEITVAGLTEQARRELAGEMARIYLHPTFHRPIRPQTFDDNGTIQLPLVAYGAFTVGVQLWNDRRFELDLSRLPGAPAGFRTS